MAVSKHNLWKRQKNGLMKLVRSHSDWLEIRREMKTRKKSTPVKDSQWWDKTTTKSDRITPAVSNKSATDSQKRTQIGKKV